jgi:hypothetical protein
MFLMMDLLGTTFTFSSPVYLEGSIEYCMVLLSDSAKYQVYISRVGEVDLITQTICFSTTNIWDLYSNHRMLLHGNQVSGKILSLLFIEQTF